jgi:K(+)-stimulated pyrophosphate-energized sodium pump
MLTTLFLVLAIAIGLAALLVAVLFLRSVLKADEGSKRMREVSALIERGARSFIRIQYRVLAAFSVVVAIILALVNTFLGEAGLPIAISFVIGSLASMAAGYVGLLVATRANRRTAAAAAAGGLDPAFRVAFRAGSVMGLTISGIALLGLGLLYLMWGYVFPAASPLQLWEILAGFSFGASTVSLFARAGGGIFTKTADMAADIVGKVEQHIAEDDPRNPAAIADAVGDNVGDVAGCGADIFDSNVASILAAAILGAGIDLAISPAVPYGLLPLLVATLGTLASVVSAFFVRTTPGRDASSALNRGTYLSTAIFSVLIVFAALLLGVPIVIAAAAILGLLAGVVIGVVSDIFTSETGFHGFKPLRSMLHSAETSTATLVLSGYSYGLLSTIPSVLGIVVAMIGSFVLGSLVPLPGLTAWAGGIYGVAIAAVGLLATHGLVVSSDAYGPIVDNARGLIEHARAPKEAIDICDRLDAVGNTAKAITKGFAIGASALTVIALFAAFAELAQTYLGTAIVVDLLSPVILAGTLIGALIPVMFTGLTILGVQRNASKMVTEIRSQFKKNPRILAGESLPDYDRCISIATSGAIRELMPATVISMLATIITGVILGLQALTAYIGGAVVTGLILALFMDNAGGAWDNTKKFVESPEYDHQHPRYREILESSILGDMVGDPFKDTAGPSINTLLAVISLTATVFLPMIAVANLWVRLFLVLP